MKQSLFVLVFLFGVCFLFGQAPSPASAQTSAVAVALAPSSAVASAPALAREKAAPLPIDPVTKLVSIKDSIKVGPYTKDSAIMLVEKWSNYMGYGNHVMRYFHYLPNEKNLKLVFTSIYNYKGQPGRSYKGTSFYYEKIDSKGKPDSSDLTNGEVSFNIVFGLRGGYLLIEFTDLSYTSSKNEMGEFEQSRLLASDGIHYLTERQKPWSQIKQQYFDRVLFLSNNLSSFIRTHYQHASRPIYLSERW